MSGSLLLSLTLPESLQHQQRLDEERYIGMIEPLATPYVLFINIEFAVKRLSDHELPVPFFAYLYGVGKSHMNPTDGSIPATPTIVWGLYDKDGKIEYADQCRYQTKYLSKIVKTLVENGYTNIGSMVVDRISKILQQHADLGDVGNMAEYKLSMIKESNLLGSAAMETSRVIVNQREYTLAKRYLAYQDNLISLTPDQVDQCEEMVDRLLRRIPELREELSTIDDLDVLEEIQLFEYLERLRDEIHFYEKVTNMNYISNRGSIPTEIISLVNTINNLFTRDVQVYRPHRQQAMTTCPTPEECNVGSPASHCAIYNPKLFEQSSIMI